MLPACSSEKESVKKERKIDPVYLNDSERKNAALDHFINGTVAEAKGDFNIAIDEYQKSLNLDTSGGIYYSLAKNYYILGKIPLALQNAKKAILFDNEKIDYYELLADIFTTADQNDSAAVILDKIVALDSTNIASIYKLARLYEKSKPLKAIECYKKVTDVVGADWNVLLRVGELYEKLGMSDESIGTIEQLLSLDPSNIQIQSLLVDVLEKNKKYDRAMQVVNDMLETNPSDPEVHERKARLYVVQNMWDQASREYDFLLNLKDVPFESKLKIGVSYFAKSLSDSLLLPVTYKFFTLLNQDTSHFIVKLYLGAVEILQNKTSDKELKKAAELNSTDPQAWVQLGGLLFDNKKYKESAKLMSFCADSFPKDYVVNFIYGLGLAQTEKHSQAKPYLEKAVEIQPNDVNALSAYAFTLNQLKDYEEAVKYLDKALTLKPDDVNLLGTLGLIYNAQQKWKECDSVYEKALNLDSTNALVNNNYAYSLSERGIQLERAMEMVNFALKADSANSSYLDTKGWIFFKMGRYDEAKDYIEQAIKTGGESAAVIEHLGDIIFMQGEKKAALELWQKAFNMDSSNKDLKNKINKGEI